MAKKISSRLFVCGSCRKKKRKSSFNIERRRAHGISSRCRMCDSVRNKAAYRKNVEKRKRYRQQYRTRRRELHLTQKWGLTLQQYEVLLARQKGRCKICQRPPQKRALAVDHNHKSGGIRGLLCDSCNLGIGYFSDDPRLLTKAAKYLTRRVR